MVLANKICILLLNLDSAGVAGYPVEFRYTLFSNCWMVTCKPQGCKGLGYHNVIGEIDTVKSINEKFIEIGELTHIM